MFILRRIPAVLSLLILAAHFLRSGSFILLGSVLGLLLLLFVPRRWARITVQSGLGLGVLEWLRTLTVLAMARRELDQPYLRLAIILGAVAAFSSLSAWLLSYKNHPSNEAKI